MRKIPFYLFPIQGQAISYFTLSILIIQNNVTIMLYNVINCLNLRHTFKSNRDLFPICELLAYKWVLAYKWESNVDLTCSIFCCSLYSFLSIVPIELWNILSRGEILRQDYIWLVWQIQFQSVFLPCQSVDLIWNEMLMHFECINSSYLVLINNNEENSSSHHYLRLLVQWKHLQLN